MMRYLILILTACLLCSCAQYVVVECNRVGETVERWDKRGYRVVSVRQRPGGYCDLKFREKGRNK